MFYFGMTDTGKKRSQNQDSFICVPLGDDSLLCVVCDGMGGMAGGNIASTTAVGIFSNYITEHWSSEGDDISAIIVNAANAANAAVYKKAEEDSSLKGMGTTLVAAVITGKKLYAANIGDSRLYMDGGSSLAKITKDHSLVQYLVDIGQITAEEAEKSPQRNMITRAVGSESEVETDIYTIDIGEGTNYLLLCSDGLTNYLSEDRIHSIITASPEKDDASVIEKKVVSLINGANKGGGGDNITAVVVKISN